MEILRDIMYYGLPILVSLYVCGWLYPRLNPKDAPRGRVGLLHILACVAAVAVIFLLNALIWATVAFMAIVV